MMAVRLRHLAHMDSIKKMEVIILPYRFAIHIWRVVSSQFPIMSASKIYIGSAGSIPARQIDRNVNKLRSFYFYLSLVITAGLLYYMDEVKIKC